MLYVVGMPEIAADVRFVRDWRTPQTSVKPKEAAIEPPSPNDVAEYLAAFYHRMQVKVLPPETLRFSQWR